MNALVDISGYLIAGISAGAALLVRFVVAKALNTGNVKTSNAETVFKASEEVRNDLATELAACRVERDHYMKLYNNCMEARNVNRSQ